MDGHPVLLHDIAAECPDRQLIEHMNTGGEQSFLPVEGDKLLAADGLINPGPGFLNHAGFRRQHADRSGQHVGIRKLNLPVA
ncbi:Uncharacterised protein [Salmonella enterica subsp. enterica serovar Typhimurium str. DT104]|nr:Uncharacterised protein [Salmonella enterica subsp. enterica serovar Typhimurium str. DT104]